MKTLLRHWPSFLAAALCVGLSLGCTKASKARRVLAAAERDYKTQNYDSAEIEYQTVLSLSRLNPLAVQRLGFIYADEGRTLEAVTYLRKAAEQDPKNNEVQLRIAEIYAGSSNTNQAAHILDSVLTAEPTNALAMLMLAQVCDTLEIPRVRQRLETTLRQNPQGGAGAHSALGFLDLRQDKTNDAALEFQQATALDSRLPSPYQGRAALSSMRRDVKGIEDALKTASDLSPVRSAARLRYAEFRTQTGDAEGARKVLEDITSKAPDYIPAWLYLMRMSFSEHKFDDCKQSIERILSRDTLNYDALLETGILAMAQQDVAKALNTFQNLDEVYKNVKEVKYYLALADLMNNEKQKATAQLNDALALDRDYPQAVLLLSQLYFRSGHLSEAIRLLTRLTNDHPENAKAQLALADAYMAENQPDRTLEVYRRMEQMFPKEPEVLLRIAIVYQGQGNAARARATMEKALSLAPDNLRAVELFTDMDITDKRFAEAHSRLAALIEKNPKAAQPFVLQGNIYVAESLTNQAEQSYSKAIELDPAMPVAYLNLARLYVAAHEDREALKRLETLAAKTNDTATLMIGEIHQQAGRYDEARAAYERLLASNPKNFLALNNLAYVDSEFLGQVDRAFQLAQTARQLRPYDSQTADTLGWILYKKREYTHALTLLQESLEQRMDPEVAMHLGMAYYMMEEEKPAHYYLQRALASPQDYPGKQLVRRRLDVLNVDTTNPAPAVAQELQALIQEDPQDPVPLSRMASIQEQKGDFDGAIQSLQNLLSINDQVWTAMVRLSALYADRKHDLRKAMELAKQAHVLAPNEPTACAALGELVFRSGGDFPWSLSLLRQAADQQSDSPSLNYYLALAYYSVGRTAQADETMQLAARQNGNALVMEKARQYLAMRAALNSRVQAESSLAQAEEILRKDPDDVPALMVGALLAENPDSPDKAAEIYDKALSIYPGFTPAMRQLAMLYSHSDRKRDWDKAYDMAEKARAAMPDDLPLAKTLGILAYRRADYNRSMLVLRELAGTSKTDGELCYYLGMDYYNLQQPGECKLALGRALDQTIPVALADQARRVLKELK